MRRTYLLFLSWLFVCALTVSTASAEGAWGRLRAATGSIAVRENPDNSALKVRMLKAGQVVRVDYESGGWVAIFDPAEKKRSESSAWGYVRMDQLRLAGPLDLPRGGNAPAASAALARIEVAKGQGEPEKTSAEDTPRVEEKAKAPKAASAHKEEAKAAAKAEDKPKQEGVSKREVKAEAKLETKPEPKAKPEPKSKPGPKQAAAKAKAGKASDAEKGDHKGKPKPEAKAFGEIRVADRDLAIRSKRDKDSEFVTLLRPGQRVRVDFRENGFYAVFDVNETVRDISRARGYSRDKYLLQEKDVPAELKAAPAATSKEEAAEKPKGKAHDKPADKPAEASVDKVESKAGAKVADKLKDNPKDKAPVKKPSAVPPAPTAAPAPVAAPPRAPAKPVEQETIEAYTYSLLERRTDPLRPTSAPLVRVRLEAATPPSGDALRTVVQEIAKAERHKGEELVLEVYLPGAEPTSLAYAVARFAQDGRMRDFLWRESLLRNKN